MQPTRHAVHAGDVYLNERSLYEAASLADVLDPQRREFGYNPFWTHRPERILHPEDTVYQWFAQVDDKNTTIYANFQGSNPNEEFTEINVRKCCFYPEKTGINYITVSGFEMAQAACPWVPPTADQPGLLGTHWSKGWIIENNHIHDAKCSAISIGKEASTCHNLCSLYHRKPGYQHQMESIFRARQIGWSKETIGSHIIRNNVIHDCGQNGIVGHLGCIFSHIYDNHIYNIGVKHEFFGYEIAGIKLHAAIDVQLIHNRIHDCTLGAWFDWQAQGIRVSRNLFYRNNRDLMIEVTHGPHMVDNNIFASEYNCDNIAHGGAFIHNLCCGFMRREQVLNRATPYHFPHTTQIAGTTFVYGGDDRFLNNIFVGGKTPEAENAAFGTSSYDGCPSSLEAYIHLVEQQGIGDLELFERVSQPAFIDSNAYLKGASAYTLEQHRYESVNDPKIQIIEEGDAVYLTLTVEAGLLDIPTEIISTQTLGMPRIVEAPYDDPDGNPIMLNTDLLGMLRSTIPTVGPLEMLEVGDNHIKVWADRIG